MTELFKSASVVAPWTSIRNSSLASIASFYSLVRLGRSLLIERGASFLRVGVKQLLLSVVKLLLSYSISNAFPSTASIFVWPVSLATVAACRASC